MLCEEEEMKKIFFILLVCLLSLPLILQAQKFTSIEIVNTTATSDSGNEVFPCIIQLSNGSLYCVWESFSNISGAGTDADLFYATNSGSGWSAPTLLNTNGTTDTGGDYSPVIIERSNGDLVCVWHSTDSLNGTAGTDFDIFYSTNTGSGWAAPAVLHTYFNSDPSDQKEDFPHLIEDSSGNLWCVCESKGTDDYEILWSVDTGSGWTSPLFITSNTGNDYYPWLCEGKGGKVYCVWVSEDDLSGTIDTDADILYSYYSGGSWSSPAYLNSFAPTDASSDQDNYPRTARLSDGTLYCAWSSRYDLGGTIGTDSDILYSYNTGSGWSAAAVLNGNASAPSSYNYNQRIVCDNNNKLHCVWPSYDNIDGVGTDYDLAYANYNGSSWSYPMMLNCDAVCDSEADYHPWIMVDSSNTLHCVWYSKEDVTGTIGTDGDIFYEKIATPYLGIDYGSSYGLYQYENGVHTRLNTISPDDVISADTDGDGEDELVIDYGPAYGLYICDSGVHTKISTLSPLKMLAANMDNDPDEELMIYFSSPKYLWQYDEGSWTQVNAVPVDHMIAADIDGDIKQNIIIDYGSYGLWEYEDGTHTQINTINPQSFISANLDSDFTRELVIDYGSYGLYSYNEGTHTKWHYLSPEKFVACDTDGDDVDEICIDFGNPYYFWEYDSGAWTRINIVSPQDFIAIDFECDNYQELLIDYGSYGVYTYDGASHTKINPVNPDSMVRASLDNLGDQEAIIDYGSYGIWTYNGTSHTQINTINPESCAPASNFQKYY